KRKGAADVAVVPRHEELVDRVVRRLECRRLDATADRPQPGTALAQQVLDLVGKTKVLQLDKGQRLAQRPRRPVQFSPDRILGKKPYFVGFPEDEIIVRIRSDSDFLRCRAETSERFQSSPVIVLKRVSLFRGREPAALDAGRSSGEGVLHGSSRLIEDRKSTRLNSSHVKI